jgi:hypothetical protein
MSEYVYPSKSVHITQKNLGKKVILRPSKTYTPVGVSFAPTVKKALEAVPLYHNRHGNEHLRRKDWIERQKWVNKSSEWNVYTPVRKRKAMIPSTIDDFKRTGERRVLGKVQSKKIGRIKVQVKNNKWMYKWL